MKKLIIILSLLCVSFVTKAQIQTPDTTLLSPKELFAESDDWNDVGLLQSYIDFSKDVLSASNLSVGIIGRQISSTLNLGYTKSSLNGQWGHSVSASLNPMWNYYGVGYGLSRNTQNRTTTLQTFYSTDFDFQKSISVSYIDIFRTQKWGTFGYSLTTSKMFWDPQIFTISDVYKTFKNGQTDISYFNKFNLDLYYGTSIDWKVTNRFVLNTNVRFNKTLDASTETIGYKKSNPIMFMIGTNFQF
jgi:hypothetical protein